MWKVGGGIASMAAAAFLIRDAGVPGENTHILETLDVPAARWMAPSRPSSPVRDARRPDA